MRLRRRIASVDFTEEMMPKNRKEVFFDVFKLHWFDLFKLGLILLAVMLPVIVLGFIADAYEASIYSGLAKSPTAQELAAAKAQAVSFNNTTSLICIPLYMLFNLALAGTARVIRQYGWEEVTFFKRDLWIGIKQNWKQYVSIALFMGINNSVGLYINGFGISGGDSAVKVAGGIYQGITWLLFFPVCAYMLIQICIYSNTVGQNVKIGIALFSKTPVKTFLILVPLCAVFAVSLIPNGICHIVGRALGALIAPTTLLVWFLFVSDQLDKYINPDHFPELVGRGTYRETNKNIIEVTCSDARD